MRDTEPPTLPAEREFLARLDAVPQTAAFARDFCERGGLDAALAARLVLVIEEFLTNTVQHGHGGDSDRSVRVALWIDAGRVGMVYEDDAPAFDPVAAAERTSGVLDDASHERRVGGLGLAISRGVTCGWRYRRVDGRNRTELEIAPVQAASGARSSGES